jgi:hypothetical protein
MARYATQLCPTPAHARVVDESLPASAVSSPNEGPALLPEATVAPQFYLWVRVSALVSGISLKPFGNGVGRLNFGALFVLTWNILRSIHIT